MNLKNINSDICRLITKGYFAQAKDAINLNANLNQTDGSKRTPLILCSLIDEVSWAISLTRLLLEYGAKIDKYDNNQMNVIHYCTIFEQVDLLKLLLESIDFDINKTDRYGNNPLIYAIIVDNEIITEMLLIYYKRYQIDIDKRNVRGINAFMQACLCGNFNVIKQLENMGCDKSAKDNNGKSSYSYKQDALAKLELDNQINEYRRQSRLVRFDDIERIFKLQQETINLKSDVKKLPEFSDPNLDRINQIKSSVKKVKRNKIDMYYVSKNMKNSFNASELISVSHNLKFGKIRPKTVFSTSEVLRSRNDWYSLLVPLCRSLEQQNSASFKLFIKTDTQNIDHVNCINERSKNRQRRSSRSIGSHSRRTSISSRIALNDDTSNSGAVKSKKKLETVVSAKAVGRNLSRLGLNNLVV